MVNKWFHNILGVLTPSHQVYKDYIQMFRRIRRITRTGKLLPPCRGEIHGRQLRNNAKLTQPRARTNRYACSPIPYYVELINSKLP